MKLTFLAVAVSMLSGSPAQAQTRTIRQTATTYGARLNADAVPSNLNPNRVNNRVNSRLDTRLSLRIERFRVGNDLNPTAAYRVQVDDKSRAAPVVTQQAPSDPDAPN